MVTGGKMTSFEQNKGIQSSWEEGKKPAPLMTSNLKL